MRQEIILREFFHESDNFSENPYQYQNGQKLNSLKEIQSQCQKVLNQAESEYPLAVSLY